jgi:hypothetical protein
MRARVDRRGFLKVTGGALAGTLATNGTAAADPALWLDYLARPNTHPQIPNVSYAGYHRGERPLPRPPVRADVRQFGAVGDGVTDSTAAINAAIDAVGAMGGGAVLVPSGRYKLSGVVWMHHSNVVLRGSGRDSTTLFFDQPLGTCYRQPPRFPWSWSGGLVWFIPRPLRAGLESRDFQGNEGWMDNWLLSGVTDEVSRGSLRIPVANPRAFRAGQQVLLLVDNPTDNSFLRHVSGDIPGAATYPWTVAGRRLRPEISDWPLAENFRFFRWPVRIERVEPGAVVLAQPVRTDLRTAWNPRFTTLGPAVRESGIEGLTLEMREVALATHNQDPGFNGTAFQAALDCWAREVDVVHGDNGFGLTSSKNITLTDVRVRGKARHHSFICRVQSHDMLIDRFEIPQATTPVTPGAAYHGINTEGLSSGNVWSNGVMDGTFDSHRALPFDSVRTAISINNTGSTGGAGDAGPRWGARICHWNVEVTNGRSHAIRLEQHAPTSAMVGIRGTTSVTDHARDFSGPLDSIVDSLDTGVAPANLYEAQLRARSVSAGRRNRAI